MPDIKFDCPHCRQSLEAPEDMANELIDCPTCGKAIQVPVPPRPTPKLRLKNEPPPKPPASPSCRYCGAAAPTGAVFCVACGRDLKTGRQFRTEIDPVAPRRREPPRPVQQSSNSGWIVLLVLLVAGYFGYQVYRDKTGGSSGGAATSQRTQAQPSRAELAQPESFTLTATVRAFTLKGNYFPNHSITYELLVNGEKVRSLDGTSTSMEFPNVPVKVGDVVTGRALWRNGYGAVGKINESYDKKHTVSAGDRNGKVWLQTYENQFVTSSKWW